MLPSQSLEVSVNWSFIPVDFSEVTLLRNVSHLRGLLQYLYLQAIIDIIDHY